MNQLYDNYEYADVDIEYDERSGSAIPACIALMVFGVILMIIGVSIYRQVFAATHVVSALYAAAIIFFGLGVMMVILGGCFLWYLRA